jgi:hypothetical protein
VHRARLSDLLMYIHELLQDIIMTSSEADAATGFMLVDWARFQNLLRLQNDLAHWLNVVVNPDTDSPAD